LLDAEFIPGVQEQIRQMTKEREAVEQELRDLREPTEQDVNEQTLQLLHSLYGLAYCCRLLARPENDEWDYHDSHAKAAPGNVRRLLRKIAAIRIRTETTGEGRQTRHKFLGGDIEFAVGPGTGSCPRRRTARAAR